MRVADVAAEPDRQQAAAQLGLDWPVDGAGDGEVALAVGCLDQLRDDLSGGLERGAGSNGQVPPKREKGKFSPA
jgi:hypothetical protein